jgi:hypothetical protein
MAHSLLVESDKYAIYVKVLAGKGDGQIVTIDSTGHIRVGGGDPGPLRERIQQAVKQIESGAAAFQAATELNPQPLPPKAAAHNTL